MKGHKCDGCPFRGEYTEPGFRPFGVCTRETNLIEAQKAYKAETCRVGNKKDMPDLSRYTKDELIELCKAIAFHASPLCADQTIRYCLIEIDHRRNLKKIDEADKHAKAADQARREYIELLKPYQGKPWADIPLNVLEKMRGCLEISQREEKIYLKMSAEVE